MDRLNPQITNLLKAQQGVGSSSIEHTHQLPRQRRKREVTTEPVTVPDEAKLDAGQEPETVVTERTRSKLSQFFRAALHGIKGEDYDSTET